MDCSTLGLPVPHHLLEFAQVHVHCISDASSHVILWCPLRFCPQSFPASGIFPKSHLFISDDQNTGASTSVSVLPVNIQGLTPLRFTGLSSLLSKGLSGVFPASPFEGINSLVLYLLYSPCLTTIGDHWEDHNLGYTDPCLKSNVSAFQLTI